MKKQLGRFVGQGSRVDSLDLDGRIRRGSGQFARVDPEPSGIRSKNLREGSRREESLPVLEDLASSEGNHSRPKWRANQAAAKETDLGSGEVFSDLFA